MSSHVPKQAQADRRRWPMWFSPHRRILLVVSAVALIAGGALAFRVLSAGDTPEAQRPAAATESAPSAEESSEPPPAPAADSTQAAQPDVGNAYRAAVIEVNNAVSSELDALTRQLVVADYDDPAWVAATTSTLADMRATAARARALSAPADLADAHAAWIEGIDSYDWAAENMAVAIQGPDLELMDRCTERLAGASASFKTATGLMRQAP